MTKILGLDLGTNSIGWAIRDNDDFYDNQIIDKGVIIFNKGVGDGKSGEFSLAAERRSNRGKRRLYNAKRYRKWATLKLLIENNMCPLSMEEFDNWRIGKWGKVNYEIKNFGRVFPTSVNFLNWLRMDFNEDGISDYQSPYEIRVELADKFDDNDKNRLFKIGRVLYHLTQRRGFKTNRKSGKSSYGENEYFKKFYESHPDKINWTASKIWMYLLSQVDENEKLRIKRIRNSGIIQRDEYEKEFNTICTKQKLNNELIEKLRKAIYYVRPLRSQKGLVGKCTFENGKPRIPVSHPLFEEFRALQFINNIKWRKTNSKNVFEPIPIELKKKIFSKLFFKKRKYFPFEEIVQKFSNNREYEFNFAKYKPDNPKELKTNPSVSACPVIAGFISTFEDKWQNIFLERENEFGINWDGLSVEYKTKQYGKEKKVELNYEGLWHLLFDYLQTHDKEEELKTFAQKKLGLNEDTSREFANIDIQQGYGSLSRNAISKINPYLKKGIQYERAVIFANLETVIGKDKYNDNKIEIEYDIDNVIKMVDNEKEKLNIANSLIQSYFAQIDHTTKATDSNYQKPNGYEEYIEEKIEKYFSKNIWQEKSDEEKNDILNNVSKYYYRFLGEEQSDEEKASYKPDAIKIKYDYYKLPRRDLVIKQMLQMKYDAKEDDLKHLYHHSDVEIYPKSVNRLGDPNPPTKGFKNPMAMRTLYELKHLLNYLLKEGKIDENTKIVIELARELNDANYRKAYSDWIKDKENENNEYRLAIQNLLKSTSEPVVEDYNKFACATEQISDYSFIDDKTIEFKNKYDEFIKTFLDSNFNGDKGIHDHIMHLILTKEEFAKMLNYSPPNTNKWVTQIIKKSGRFRENRKSLKEMITKYRLWKEQKYHCFYTGRIIPLSELYTPNYQLEHTIPRSISFDSELKNLTVCDAIYNNQIKSNKFPTECPNFKESYRCQTIDGNKNCSPIIDRVKTLIEPKVNELKRRISELKHISKGIPDWERDKKDANIRLRHYLNFELDYWDKKLFTFTVKKDEWKNKFKNSQLIDTQIVSTYARAYLKSLFNKVDVQKGNVTAIFREIYRLPPKSRDNHAHHAIDAAVLTLIPGSATRDLQVEKYFEWKENKSTNYIRPKPYDTFEVHHIKEDIENTVLVNHITKDKTLTPSKKYSRKNGKIEYLKGNSDGKIILDENGNKKPKLLKGDSIRGQLHKETFYGAIKVNERNENGYPIKQDGKYIIKQNNNQDEIWIVCRKKITEIDYDKDVIVDELLSKFIKKQLNEGANQNELIDFNNRIIRHLRCRFKAGKGFFTNEKAIHLKEHIFKSKYKHKQDYLVQNEENYLYLLYEGKDNKDEIISGYKIINLFDIATLNLNKIEDLKTEPEFQSLEKKKGRTIFELQLKNILKVGDRVIFYKENKEEITNDNAKDRLFYIIKFNEPTPNTAYIYFQNHIEARENEILKNLEEKDFIPDKYQPRIFLTCTKLNCLFENKDFKINIDGTIYWLNHHD
ncbi:MAG: HNH endonuclease domain-containing protein [Ignavibacteria bacterium]|nr:HNH endonuclease domain-containing protein [Ignavibacteria bacterium]